MKKTVLSLLVILMVLSYVEGALSVYNAQSLSLNATALGL